MDIPHDEKFAIIQKYDDLALETFIIGLNGQLERNVILRNPTSLETAMALVIEEESFLQCQTLYNDSNQNYFTPSYRINSINHPNQSLRNKPNYFNHSDQFNNYHHFNNNNPNRNSNKPINQKPN